MKYDLLLEYDSNTRGCTGWFFFSISNTFKDNIVTINILNMSFNQKLYLMGMQPLIFSMKSFVKHKIGWHRAGFDIFYFKERLEKERHHNNEIRYFYTLRFSYRFKYEHDIVFFSAGYPYPFS